MKLRIVLAVLAIGGAVNWRFWLSCRYALTSKTRSAVSAVGSVIWGSG